LLYKPWADSAEQKRTLLKSFRASQTHRESYFLKTELQNLFHANIDKTQAETHLTQSMEQAQKVKHKAMEKFLRTLQTWKNDILNFFTYRISNGIVEGMNHAIKTLKRMAYGFRNVEHFRNRILVSFL